MAGVRRHDVGYHDVISRLYSRYRKSAKGPIARSVTFQVTNQCNLRCSYCYEHNKCDGAMSIYTAKKCVDAVLDMYEKNDPNMVISHDTKAIIFDFIGGEPLLEAKLMEEIIDYFMLAAARRGYTELIEFSRVSFATNGQLWFTPETQHLMDKYHEIISPSVSIDGIQELHDKYRIDQYGNGSFEKALKAFIDIRDRYGVTGTKMTFTPGSTKYLSESVKFMHDLGCVDIMCNYAFEPVYTISDARNIYFELKKLADILIDIGDDTYVSILDGEDTGEPSDNDNNWCGGTGKMLMFAPDGKCYPCLRYAPISVGNKLAEKMCIGDCFNGIYNTERTIALKNELEAITRTSQSPEKCLTCSVAGGCAWCSGANYEMYGTPNKRSTNICNAHKGRVLAICYYYNQRHLKLHDMPAKKMYLPYDETVEFVGKEETDYLFALEKEAFATK